MAGNIYEVAVKVGESQERIYLVDAISQAAARKHVAEKYVGKAHRCDVRRVAELLQAGIKLEIAQKSEVTS